MSEQVCRLVPAGRVWLVTAALAGMAMLAGAASAMQARADGTTSAPSVTTDVVRFASVVGVAWQADNAPIPGARVRLRDVSSGRAAAHAVADDAGRFTFEDVLPGSYVVELVNQSGQVLTVGPRFTIARGETVATLVRLGSRSPWANGFFANAAAAVAAAAAAAGVTAIAPEVIRPASTTR